MDKCSHFQEQPGQEGSPDAHQNGGFIFDFLRATCQACVRENYLSLLCGPFSNRADQGEKEVS